MKDYKKILEGVMNIINTTEISDIGFANICAYISENCPELAESADERIRKAIICGMTVHKNHGKETFAAIPINDCIAWLEKQGTPAKLSEEEQNRFAKGVLTSCASSFIDYLDAHKYEGKMCVSNGECEDIENAFHNAMWDKLHRYYGKYIERQGKKPAVWSEEDETKAKVFLINKGYPIDANGVFPTYEEMYNIIREGLEQQSEQNHADKVEPKFKVGDWIVNNKGKDVFFIKSINSGYYSLEDTKGNIYSPCLPFESDFHLWTIADAKDGDVLVAYESNLTEDGYIILFKELLPQNGGVSYCHYNYNCTNPHFEFNEDDNWLFDGESGEIHPATKEQRDLLFAKMKEAGYEWDAEKKELKIALKETRESIDDAPFEQESTENEELTEFDKAVGVSIGTWNPKSPEQIQSVKAVSKKLLKLAKKQINDEQKPAELGENRSKELSLSLQIQAYLNTASDELYAKGKPLYSEERIKDIHKCMIMWQKLHNAYFYQKPMEDFNGDAYGIDSLWHAITILEKTLGEVEGYQTDDGILEHKCAITAVRKLAKEKREQKPWSEEVEAAITLLKDIAEEQEKDYCPHNANDLRKAAQYLETCRPQNTCKPSGEHYELEEFAKIVRCNLTGISKAVQQLFEAKYLQLTGNKMYGGFKD